MNHQTNNIEKIAILQTDGKIIEIVPDAAPSFEVERKFEELDDVSPIGKVLKEQIVTLKIQYGSGAIRVIEPSKTVIKRIAARRKKKEKAERARKRKEAARAAKDRLIYDEEFDYDVWA